MKRYSIQRRSTVILLIQQNFNILTEVLAEEYKESGPKFNSLSLGSVNTPMLKKAFPGYEAQVDPDEMASYIYNFANTGSKLFNGKVIPISSSTP